MSRRPLRTPGRETCAFCGCHETTERAVELGWVPYFWIVGQSGATNEPMNAASCVDCQIKHLVDDPQDRGDGPMLKHGHARYLRAARARRLVRR